MARAVAELGLKHVVITSVDRDDLPDGGASHFAAVVRSLHRAVPECAVEVLTPDFKQDPERSLELVLAERPAIFSHNIETVPELYRVARPGSRFEHSLDLLRRASARKAAFGGRTKTAIMLGLGETDAQVHQTMRAVREAGVDIMAMGQYLRPTAEHLPVQRYVSPPEFARFRDFGLGLGLAHVEAGPLVRSSYHAEEQAGG